MGLYYRVRRGRTFVCADGTEKKSGERVEASEPNVNQARPRLALYACDDDSAPAPAPVPEPEPEPEVDEDAEIEALLAAEEDDEVE